MDYTITIFKPISIKYHGEKWPLEKKMSRARKNQDISARRRKRQDKGLPWAYIIPAIILIIVVVAAAYEESRPGPVATTTTDFVLAPTGAYNFPFSCLGSEAYFLHIHPWLRIVIDGKNISIPATIGIENAVPVAQGPKFGVAYGGGSSSCFEPVHTHDFSGIIHIESPTDTNYTLNNFFAIWASSFKYALINGTIQRPIVFNKTDILGYTVNSTYGLVLLVDGKPNNQYGDLVLNTLAYCNSGAPYNQPSNPCYETAQGAPEWNGGNSRYPYGTGHTIAIEYGPLSMLP